MTSLTLVLGAGACAPAPECGDGVVTDEEGCDDGNRVSGDGCSASCELDDDVRTPGDDRPGYTWCWREVTGPGELPGPGISCPPDSLCCVTDGTCAPHGQGCWDPLNVATCDGPEDCTFPRSHCGHQSHDRTCTTASTPYTYCHTDPDCANVYAGLGDGVCTPGGTCQFPSSNELAP